MSRRIAPIAVSILALAGGIAAAGPTGEVSPGKLDPSFGKNGVARPSALSQLFGAAVQADHKLVAAGQSDGRVAVARFTKEGSLDSSFNRDGIYIYNGSMGTDDAGHGVAIDSSGRILVAATTRVEGMTAIRLMPNGARDSSFSDDGIAGASLAGGQGLDLALQGDKVVVAGAATTTGGHSLAVARFTGNGGLDESFGSGGRQIYDIYGYGVSTANAVAIDGDGKIVLAGSQSAGARELVLAARLNRNGTPDTDFGTVAGVPSLYLGEYQRGAGYSAAFDVKVDPNDRPVLAGVALVGLPSASRPQGSDAIAVRLTKAGIPDDSFAVDGVYRAATASREQYLGSKPYPGAYGVTLAGSDIILGGYFDKFGQKQLALWALDQDGQADGAFEGLSTESGELNALAIAGDGDLLGVGDVSDIFHPSFAGLAAEYGGVGPPPPVPASLSLAPGTATNTVRTQHCVIATVADQNGAPLSDIAVGFEITGANPADGSAPTDTKGEARFCYLGQDAGDDTIRASARGQSASVSKTWEPGPLDPPEPGASVNVIPPETGTVLVSLPDGDGFVPIEEASQIQIPVRSVIDPASGRVRLVTAKKHRPPQTARFSGAPFSVYQNSDTGPTEIKLESAPLRCHRARRHRARRPLVGDGQDIRTLGNNGSATVAGVHSAWLTEDRCDGTFFTVKEGVVVVRDFTRHRTIALHAGEHYLAKTGFASMGAHFGR